MTRRYKRFSVRENFRMLVMEFGWLQDYAFIRARETTLHFESNLKYIPAYW